MQNRISRPGRVLFPARLLWLMAFLVCGLGLEACASAAEKLADPARASTGAHSTNLHWSFQSPAWPAIPPIQNQKGRTENAVHPIDAFVRARLAAAGLKPSPPADRTTLIRRLSLDLLGLPPSPENVRAFVSDRRPDAFERLVDQLLASPHFGERWGRHWLDLARYADSDGYEKDGARPYAYLYRDWVIDAINRDLPFDQFSMEQLAGDLLPNATTRQRIATGFHRQTLINKEGGVDQEEYRCRATVDRAHTTGAVWLGLTVGCAECHSHKYDPISQREFYELYAFFNRASDAELSLPTDAQRAAHERAVNQWKKSVGELEEKLSRARPASTNSTSTPTSNSTSKPLTSSTEATEAGPGAIESTEATRTTETNSPPNAEVKRREEELNKLRQAEPRLKADTAMILEAADRSTHVHVRGDFLRKAEAVEPNTPAFLPPLHARGPVPDRLDLARWLFAPEQPLTARVTVNHVWRHLFGRGLVATENDFGLRGEPPSHPELLDWLAREFVRLGWSRKQLIRGIVTSDTYRQSSAIRRDLAERDPLNVLLARQGRFRVDAEVVRDAALAVSGLLNRRVGGPSFKPPLPQDLANLNYANGLKWDPATPEEQHRRGLYIHFQRTVPYPMLMAFDAPESTVTCTRRERSNSPLQALTLLNNELFLSCAQALARRLEADPHRPEKTIRPAVELVTGRAPTRAEQKALHAFWINQHRLFLANPAAARDALGSAQDLPKDNAALAARATAVALARVLLNLEETMTRE
jgi:hypothetical protein